jgi:hypothetical protein
VIAGGSGIINCQIIIPGKSVSPGRFVKHKVDQSSRNLFVAAFEDYTLIIVLKGLSDAYFNRGVGIDPYTFDSRSALPAKGIFEVIFTDGKVFPV